MPFQPLLALQVLQLLRVLDLSECPLLLLGRDLLLIGGRREGRTAFAPLPAPWLPDSLPGCGGTAWVR
jgi:hypothetical protein